MTTMKHNLKCLWHGLYRGCPRMYAVSGWESRKDLKLCGKCVWCVCLTVADLPHLELQPPAHKRSLTCILFDFYLSQLSECLHCCFMIIPWHYCSVLSCRPVKIETRRLQRTALSCVIKFRAVCGCTKWLLFLSCRRCWLISGKTELPELVLKALWRGHRRACLKTIMLNLFSF